MLTPAIGAILMAASTVVVAINARLLKLNTVKPAPKKLAHVSERDDHASLKEKIKQKSQSTESNHNFS